MALFEIFIPPNQPEGFNVTAKVRADSWVQALRHGLVRLGDTADMRNVIADITENGIDVTEPHSGRVFRIRELEETAAELAHAAARRAAAGKPALKGPPPPALKPQVAVAAPIPAAKPSTAPSSAPQARRTVTSSAATGPMAKLAAPAAPPAPRFVSQADEEDVVREKAASTAPLIGRSREAVGNAQADDMIGELFALTQHLYDQRDVRAAAAYILDLAMRSVTSESGAVFISDINASDLFFAAARGPKAQEAMKFRVPMGQGIVGFCAQEGVALAVSEVQRDPRFYAAISQSLGYETTSILCAPAQIEGRVYGAIELVNKKRGSSFNAREIGVLNFLAHEFADYLVNTGQTGA